MARASIDSIPAGLENAIALELAHSAPEADVYYAITNVSDEGDDYLVSLAGVDIDNATDDWDWLEDSVWIGTAYVDSSLNVWIEGDANYVAEVDASDFDTTLLDYGGAQTPYFPWRAGTRAKYGTLGVHANTNMPGWYAVDFVGGDEWSNSMDAVAYAAETGVVSAICRDSNNMGARIGDYYYLHMSPSTELESGQVIYRGQAIGGLVYGAWGNAGCGYAQNQPTHYHLHFEFQATSYLRVEDWTLDVSAETWHRGADTVNRLGWLYASWSSEPIPTITTGPGTPTPTPSYYDDPGGDWGGGGSIWDTLVGGIRERVADNAARYPDADDREMAGTFVSAAATMVRIFFILVKSNFSLLITVVVFGVIAVLESSRYIVAVWMFLKKSIPFL